MKKVFTERNNPEFFKKLELSKWRVPEGLGGLVLDCFEELEERVPEDTEFGEVYLRKREKKKEHGDGFDRYSRHVKGKDGKIINDESYDLAYGCPKCEKIIVGPPVIETEDTLSLPIGGKQSIEYKCSNCNDIIYDHTINKR